MNKISVLGAGTFGISLARLLANKGFEVTVYVHNENKAKVLRKTNRHERFKDVLLPDSIVYTSDLKEAFKDKEMIVYAIPSTSIREVATLSKDYVEDGQYIVDVAKGMEKDSLLTLIEVIDDVYKNDTLKYVVLSGPTHAEDFEEKENNSNSFTAPEAKVLIVDDTEINLMVAKALLTPLNMQIETAGDGYEALKKIEENSYDLIFMDHFMPGLDGVQVTKKIRSMENNPNATIPIIALTADAMSGVKEELLKEGMDDFLSKPIVLQQAHQILHRWLPKEKILFV